MKMMLTSAKLTRKKKKVSFHALIKLNTEQRRPMSNWLCPVFFQFSYMKTDFLLIPA